MICGEFMQLRWRWTMARVFGMLLITAMMVLLSGCEDDHSPSHDFGDNDSNLLVAMGDSITEGVETTPYPEYLAQYVGKTVANQGVGGEHAYEGRLRVDRVLAAYKPGFLLILYGANDLLHYHSPAGIVEELRSIVRSAKAAKTIPVLATLTPMVRSHYYFDGGVKDLNTRIRSMASDEGVRLVDLEQVFGDRDADEDPYVLDSDDYLQWDGLHPNEEGSRQIALAFLDAL
jgi:lysophospholipase L1-like esterase